MGITADDIKRLREMTGAGMMDCKAALTEAGGSFDEAVVVLRKKGLAKAAKKAGRAATEGLVEAYIHPGGRLGVLVEVNCETDFAARSDDFKQLVRDIAMQVAAAEPRFVRREEVGGEHLAQEREIYAEQAKKEGKPEKIIQKIVDGRMEKFYEEACLWEQRFIKNNDITVATLVQQVAGKIGENVSIRRFVRFKLGEGLEKRAEDFAGEVQKLVGPQ
jgi:elongation factor Ts